MTDAETDRLVAEMEALADYRGWSYSYEYPGYFCYHHTELPFRVAFTPDWGEPETASIQVEDDDGVFYEEHSSQPSFPNEGRTGQTLFDLVRPTLDKLLALPPPAPPAPPAPTTFDLHVTLTPAEVAALQSAHEHVRAHMAHEHPWEVRDTAMGAIGKVLAAAREAAS